MSKKVVRFTVADREVAERYQAAEPKQFGNLHERMKFLMKLAEGRKLHETHQEIHHAIWDLLTEVQHTEPAEPPFGQRVVGTLPNPSRPRTENPR